MHCRQTEPRLQALLDSRQDIDADPQLYQHVETCAECATLAAAYCATVRPPAGEASAVPIAGLADRVLAEVVAPSSLPRKSGWHKWATLAVAASLLVAIGIALQQQDPQAPSAVEQSIAVSEEVPQTMDQYASSNAELVDNAVREIAGREMWFRTGQSLASISLPAWRSQPTPTSETETPGDAQLLDRAYDTIRTLLPPGGETQTPSRGETGWRSSAGYVAVC